MGEDWKWRSIRLRMWSWDALADVAKKENRTQSEQARHMIEEALRKQGYKEHQE